MTGPIETVAATGSTNADLIDRVRMGDAREGQWLRAERQTAGRGRQGRTWQSVAGNLHASTIIALRLGDPMPTTLSLTAGVALAEAVARHVGPHADLQLKWPNDLLLGGAKVAGILLERSGEHVVAGFGVNVRSAVALPDRATTTLQAHGCRVDAATVCATLVHTLAAALANWRRDGAGAIIARWLTLGPALGSQIRVREQADAEPVVGRFAGLDADGALLLGDAGGQARRILSGDVLEAGLPSR